jgi:hypothetical protein
MKLCGDTQKVKNVEIKISRHISDETNSKGCKIIRCCLNIQMESYENQKFMNKTDHTTDILHIFQKLLVREK